MPPMATEKSEGQGKVSDALCEYYNEKTKGGYFGLVVAEHSYISKEGQASKGQVSFSSDDDIPGLKRLVEVIHRNGCKVPRSLVRTMNTRLSTPSTISKNISVTKLIHASGVAKIERSICTLPFFVLNPTIKKLTVPRSGTNASRYRESRY